MTMQPVMNDTIVAVSSAPQTAANAKVLQRAIIRLSGSEAFSLALQVFAPHSEAGLNRSLEKRRWCRQCGKLVLEPGTVEADAYFMPAPRSYTRQDVVELHLPAARPLIGSLLERLVLKGARTAQQGEFTRRAFLNGRISLEQAAAIGRLISAESATEARAVAAKAAGHRGSKFTLLQDGIMRLLSLLELGLDFSLEDVELLPKSELTVRLSELITDAKVMAVRNEQTRSGLSLQGLPRVVLAGAPNSGKSTLFNTLIDRDEALTSDQAHTTRDVVRAMLNLSEEVGVELFDTAGRDADSLLLKSQAEVLGRQIQGNTERVLDSAEILLFALDASELTAMHPFPMLKMFMDKEPRPAIALVATKADIAEKDAVERIASEIRESVTSAPLEIILVSSHSGAGLKRLKSWLESKGLELRQRAGAAEISGEAVEGASATRILQALERARNAAEDGLGEDVVALELREALHVLAQVEGILLRHDELTEGLLDRIFSNFCIGK